MGDSRRKKLWLLYSYNKFSLCPQQIPCQNVICLKHEWFFKSCFNKDDWLFSFYADLLFLVFCLFGFAYESHSIAEATETQSVVHWALLALSEVLSQAKLQLWGGEQLFRLRSGFLPPIVNNRSFYFLTKILFYSLSSQTTLINRLLTDLFWGEEGG